MTYEQIMALSDKGFTPDQIVRLSDLEGDPVPEQTTGAEAENPATEPEGAAGPADPGGETPSPPPDPFKEFRDSINKMLSDISAIKAAQQEANIKEVIRPAPEAVQSADDILAGFIRPEMKEENRK